MTVNVLTGDCREVLATLPDQHFHCCVTSPPYFGLRDYGTGQWEGGDAECDHQKTALVGAASTLRSDGRKHVGPYDGEKAATMSVTPFRDTCGKCGARRVDRQIGLEQTPDAFVAELVAVFREVRRVLRDDGTLWLNLGDSYAANRSYQVSDGKHKAHDFGASNARSVPMGLKPKDLIGIPWRVAFALQADGWYLRQDIIWAKPNPMPESVTDRCTKSHEYIFLLSKSARYYYDQAAIAETAISAERTQPLPENKTKSPNGETPWLNNRYAAGASGFGVSKDGARNRRSVWTIATQPYSEAHFATFPPALVEPCILAGCPAQCCSGCGSPYERQVKRVGASVKSPTSEYGNGAGRNDGGRSQLVGASSTTLGFAPSCGCNGNPSPGRVLDPFGGAGTTGLVADRLQRDATLIELNPEYAEMARRRIASDGGMFAAVK